MINKLLSFFGIKLCEHEYHLHDSHLYRIPSPWHDFIVYTFRIYCDKCGKYFESKVQLTCSPNDTKEQVKEKTKELALKIIKAKYNIKEETK